MDRGEPDSNVHLCTVGLDAFTCEKLSADSAIALLAGENPLAFLNVLTVIIPCESASTALLRLTTILLTIPLKGANKKLFTLAYPPAPSPKLVCLSNETVLPPFLWSEMLP